MHAAAFVVAIIAGAIAAMSGFGIGSLLTPLLAVHYGTKLAVAMVSIPHLVGTTARFVGLRQKVDRGIFLNFGVLSAAGGLIGALLNARAGSHALSDCLRGPAAFRSSFRTHRLC